MNGKGSKPRPKSTSGDEFGKRWGDTFGVSDDPLQITVVSGLGRCGSSLAMQMLVAGGMPAAPRARHPYWEDGRTALLPGDAGWLAECHARCLKCLNPAVKPLPLGISYRWIWIDRNRKAQRKSWEKFAEHADMERKPLDFDRDRADSMALIKRLGGPLLRLRFEDLIASPRAQALKLSSFVGGLDVDRMVQCVVKRPSSCLPYMLENNWVATTPKGGQK